MPAGHDDSIDGASMMLRDGTLLGTQDLCMPVLEENLRLFEFAQEKLRCCKGTFLRYFGSCFIGWYATRARNMFCCLVRKRVLRTPFFTSSRIQHTLSRCAIIYTQVARSRNIAKYAILFLQVLQRLLNNRHTCALPVTYEIIVIIMWIL